MKTDCTVVRRMGRTSRWSPVFLWPMQPYILQILKQVNEPLGICDSHKAEIPMKPFPPITRILCRAEIMDQDNDSEYVRPQGTSRIKYNRTLRPEGFSLS